MKKLGKLSINPEKVIKNEELVNLKGGYDGYCECWRNGSIMLFATSATCNDMCYEAYATFGTWHYF